MKINQDIRDNVTGKLLVVEDEELVRDYLVFFLEKQGYEVLAAKNAEEALSLFQDHTHNICLVLADINLPGSSGVQLMKEVRSIESEMSFILGSSDPCWNRLLADCDCSFLAKPYNKKILLEIIGRYMQSGV